MDYLPLLAPDFSLIFCGYLLCRFTALNRTMWSQVERLVYYFLFPVLLFTTIARTSETFGSLLQINAEYNEIIVSAATVDNVQIITAITAAQINQAVIA